MSKTYKGSGKRIQWTNDTGSAVVSGQVVVLASSLLAIALTDIASLATGTLIVAPDEVHELAATTSDTWTAGTPLYWVTGTSKLTDTAGSNVFAGYAWGTKTNVQTTAQVRLTGTVLNTVSDLAVTQAKLAAQVAFGIVTNPIGTVAAGAAIPVTASGIVELVTASALGAPEADRTLGDPTADIQFLAIGLGTKGTVGANGVARFKLDSGTFDGTNNTVEFADEGDCVLLMSFPTSTSRVWHLVFNGRSTLSAT